MLCSKLRMGLSFASMIAAFNLLLYHIWYEYWNAIYSNEESTYTQTNQMLTWFLWCLYDFVSSQVSSNQQHSHDQPWHLGVLNHLCWNCNYHVHLNIYYMHLCTCNKNLGACAVAPFAHPESRLWTLIFGWFVSSSLNLSASQEERADFRADFIFCELLSSSPYWVPSSSSMLLISRATTTTIQLTINLLPVTHSTTPSSSPKDFLFFFFSHHPNTR